MKVQGEQTDVFTTQVFFPDLQEANARDRIFRDDLVMRLDRADDGWRGALRLRAPAGLRPRQSSFRLLRLERGEYTDSRSRGASKDFG